MRTAGTEIGQPLRNLGCIVGTARFGQLGQPRFNTRRPTSLFHQDAAQFFGDHDGVQIRLGLEHLFAAPCRMFIAFVPTINPPPVAVIKQRLFDLHLDQLAFFLDHHNQVEPFGPFMERRHIQRPDLTYLICGDSQTLGLGRVYIQQCQCVL